jgi:hypothetical protein
MTSDIHQSNGPGIPVTRWSDIVARGQLAKLPAALQREDRNSVIYPTQSETLFEEESGMASLRTNTTRNPLRRTQVV